MTPCLDAGMQSRLVALLPNLRAFARSLSRNPDLADDLVQDTLAKAWRHRESLGPEANLKAWLFTVMRNAYLSERRRRKYEVCGEDSAAIENYGVKGAQQGHLDWQDFAKAFSSLPENQREALVLIGAEGFSYEEAAQICGCALGTVKSRVNRGRVRLAELLGFVEEYGRGASSYTEIQRKAS
jgi:RNA polymerase sigma-70 factor, ECF subfamily